MAVNLSPAADLLPVPGVRVGSACAGIKQKERHDVAVFALAEGADVGGVYTQSHFAAAPVFLARERQAAREPLPSNRRGAAWFRRWTRK